MVSASGHTYLVAVPALVTRPALTGLGAGALCVLAPTSPAVAAPVPCVQTFDGPSQTISKAPTTDPASSSSSFAHLTVPLSSGVEDVDVTVGISHARRGRPADRSVPPGRDQPTSPTPP